MKECLPAESMPRIRITGSEGRSEFKPVRASLEMVQSARPLAGISGASCSNPQQQLVSFMVYTSHSAHRAVDGLHGARQLEWERIASLFL